MTQNYYQVSPLNSWGLRCLGSKMFFEKHGALDVCVGYAKRHNLFSKDQVVCTKKLYNYVDTALLKIRNLDLPLKVRRKSKVKKARQHLKILDRSIDERPDSVLTRRNFGHWEIDTILGSKSKTKVYFAHTYTAS